MGSWSAIAVVMWGMSVGGVSIGAPLAVVSILLAAAGTATVCATLVRVVPPALAAYRLGRFAVGED